MTDHEYVIDFWINRNKHKGTTHTVSLNEYLKLKTFKKFHLHDATSVMSNIVYFLQYWTWSSDHRPVII